MKKGVPPQTGHDDSAQQGNPFHQHQGFPYGQGQFGGFPNPWGYWPYGMVYGGMGGQAPRDMRMDCEASADGAQSREMYGQSFPADTLIGLLMQSSNGLFPHLCMSKEAENAAFSALTDDERATLKEILTKLLASWNTQGQDKL